MGKGKQKGWRPPRGDDDKLGLLFGSADHISGHTVASPVTLRQEGIALPKSHPNYGDDKGKGKGKGGGKGAAAPAAEVAPPEPKAPTGGASKVAPRWARARAGVKTEAEASKSVKEEPAKPAVPLPTKEGSAKPVDDGLTEIERRRRGLQAAQEMQRRRRAADEQATGDVKEEPEEEPEVDEPDSKRARAGDDASAPQSGAMQQGLQGWAERVNMLSIEEPALAKACREFVRKRILRAHAEGNLHDVDWSEEPVPTPEVLEEMFPPEDGE